VIPIAVVIATRGPAEVAGPTVASVLRSTYPSVRVCVVDQCADDTSRAQPDFALDERVTVVKAPARGLGAARNHGVAATDAPLVAFTDDDCQVDPDWLRAIVAAFHREARIGVVFGSVRAPDYDRTSGFIQAYAVDRPRVARSLFHQARIRGIGGCMAIRRATYATIHGFDDQFGAGAPLHAAEDSDFFMRALLAGHWVSETPDAVVTHFGFCPWSKGVGLIQGYMFGLGAMHAKMLRLGGVAAGGPIVSLAWRWVAHGPAVDLNQKPPRLMRLSAFLHGVRVGWRLPIDRATGCFAVGADR
jgi:glycosyltransferase involved in cell wall biosynthesis